MTSCSRHRRRANVAEVARKSRAARGPAHAPGEGLMAPRFSFVLGYAAGALTIVLVIVSFLAYLLLTPDR